MIVLRRLSLLVLLLFLVWTPAAFAWSRPLDGPVLQPFAYDESHPYAAGQHRGIDIRAGAAGEDVIAPAAGTVSFAGSVPTSGKSVTIETPDGYSVTLTHLGSTGVAKGATVAEGDVVGTVGPSGTPEVDGPYVHLGIRLTADPLGYVDPLSLLPAVRPQDPPAPPGDPGSVATPAPPAVADPPPPAAPAPSAAPPPESPPVAADPVPASPAPDATQPGPTTTAQDPRSGAGGRTPAPGRSASTGRDVADLPGGRDRRGDGEDANSDGTDSGSTDQARDPAGAAADAVVASVPHARSPHEQASAAPVAPPAELGGSSTRVGRSLRRPLASDPLPSRPRPATSSLLSLALGIGPGLVASLAALLVALGRLRRRVAESALVEAVVVHLPLQPSGEREERERSAA